MKRAFLLTLILAAALLPATAGATGSSGAFHADVQDEAVVVTYSAAFGETNFVFDVYNCPAGQVINITWEAEQPSTGATVVGEASYVFSTGEFVQHLPLTATGHFRPGYDWVGSGVVTCGAQATPVSGSGTTVLVGGGGTGGGDDDDEDD